MNKDNKVFVNNIKKDISNNKKIYSSLEEDIHIDSSKNNKIERNINQKINDIFNSRNYIYKADVVIYTKNDTLRKRIVGKNSNYLITSSNELIPISEIIDIKWQ